MTLTIYAELAPRRKTFVAGVHVCASVPAAQQQGHVVIQHPRGKLYEQVVMQNMMLNSSKVHGISVRNHTGDELKIISEILDRLPPVLLARFAEQYRGIVCVDWTGSNWRDETHPNPTTLLSGGANMDQPRTRSKITETGRRIELTHSAMHELRPSPFGRRGAFTLWHELGHVAYRSHLTPRTVERQDYGESIHVGVEEQPAYAFMWYFLNPSRLSTNDRAAFVHLLGSNRAGATR